MTGAAPPRQRAIFAASFALVVAVVVAATFARTLANAPVWDDADLTTNNPYVQSWSGLLRILTTDLWTASAKGEPSSFYRPVASASYVVNRMLLGNSAASYHVANVALHAANALLIGAFLRGQARPLRLVAVAVPALWFALAPVNVEAVAWIAGRFDLVGTGFVVAALVANTRPSRGARDLAAALIVTALFCKEAFVTGFVILALHDGVVLRRAFRNELRKYVICGAGLVAFFACRAIVGVMSVAAVSATGPVALVQSYAFLLATFARTLVYPVHLDQYRAYVAPPLGGTLLTLAAAGALVALLARLVQTRRTDHRARLALFGVAWALITFAPASLTGPNLDIVGDRYGYYPLVGAFVALAPLVDAAWPRTRAAQLATALVVASCLAVQAHATRARLLDWRDERTLYTASVDDDPENPYALYALGYLEAIDGHFDAADALLARSVARKANAWRTLNALCYVRLHQHQPAQAERFCERSIAVQPANPRGWINLASARVNLHRWEGGLEAATRAVEMKPDSAEARYLRAACLANTGALDDAQVELREALTLDPSHAGAQSLRDQFRARGLP